MHSPKLVRLSSMTRLNQYSNFGLGISVSLGLLFSPGFLFARDGSIAKASSVIGMEVTNRTGETLGTIEDVLIEVNKGETLYVLFKFLDVEDFVAIESKYFAVPWQAIEFAPRQHTILLDVEKKLLHQAKGATKDSLQELIRQSDTLFASHQTVN